MANECSVTMYIVGNRKEITALHQKIKEWLSKAYGLSPVYKGLVYILKGAELSETDYPYRGYIADMNEPSPTENENWEFQIDYESAWSPCNAFWQAVLDKVAPHCKMYWYGEEEGCGYYKTNDKDRLYFDWDYVVVTQELKETNPFSEVFSSDDYLYLTEKELRDKLVVLFGDRPMMELMEKANVLALADNESVQIHKVTFVDE